jgi:hypothetical protein
VKIPPESVMFPGRGVSLKGSFYTRRINGQLFISKWPRKQPTPRTANEADKRHLLLCAALSTKYMSSQEQDFSRKVAKVTKLASRDFLMLALFGRLGTFVRRDGTKVFSMAAMQNVSDLLDALGQLQGMILFKGDPWWEGLAIGLEGEVLQVGPDGYPIWSPGGTGLEGAGPMFAPPVFSPPGGAATYNPGFMVGLPIMPGDDLTVHGIKIWITALGSGRTIQAALYSDNAYNMTGGTLLASTAGLTPALGVNQLDFAVPAALNKNTFYWLCFNVTGGSGNLQLLNMDFPRNNYMYFTQGSTSLPSTAPTCTPGTGGYQFNWWAF